MRQIVLARRPSGEPVAGDFAHVEAPIPAPGEGQALVRNRYLSIDPAIRGWMNDAKSYLPPIAIGAPIRSGALAEVVGSRRDDLSPGDVIACLSAWEDYSLVGPRPDWRVVPPDLPLPLPAMLGVLGGNGLTAYFGLLEVGRPEPGQTVLVSAAAGGVGGVVGQLAKIHGCRAVGTCGGEEKGRWIVEDLGFDAAIDYRAGGVCEAIRAACPGGVDVYFDNVGGPILNAALGCINRGARVVLCGAIAQINAPTLPPGPSNYIRLLTQRARMEGFVTMDYARRWSEASAQLARWVLEGRLKHREHVVEGLERAPEALAMLFSGENRGKVVVRL